MSLNIEKLIKDLEKEIISTQEGIFQTDALARLKQVAVSYKGEDKIVSFSEIYERVKTQPPVEKIWTGWEQLDKLLKGIRKKHLIVWAGVTKHGKTSLAMDLTCKLAQYNPLWLPMEESAEELMEKFLERGEKPPVGFAPENIRFVDTDWVEQKVIEGIAKYNSQIVILDNLSWISPSNSNKFDGKADRIELTVMQIKAIANKWDIPIVLVTHVNKESKADTNPTFENFKGSSAIAQLSDKAVLIWRETNRGEKGQLEITNNVNVSVQLNRQGGVGNVKMVYDNGHFIEQEWGDTSTGSLANF